MTARPSSQNQLEKLGFKRLTPPSFAELMSGSTLPDPNYFAAVRTWYAYDGDCSVDGSLFTDRDLQGLNIIVTGKLVVDGILTDSCIGGIVVFGAVKASSIILGEGPAEFRGEAIFRDALIVHSTGDYVVIREPVGPLVFCWSDPLVIEASEGKVKVCRDVVRSESFGCAADLLKPEYLEEDEDEGILIPDSTKIRRALLNGESIFNSR
ncbi:MAG: hypothetical protein AAF657_04840 [Acidobacteriota bacterium]